MGTAPEIDNTGGTGTVRVQFEKDGQTQVVVINTIDELCQLHLSHQDGVRVPMMRIRQLVASSRLSGPTLKWIGTVIPRDLLAESLEVSSKDLSRLYRRKYLSRTQTEWLEDLTYLWQSVEQNIFHGDEQVMRRWLDIPVPALDGTTPKILMGTLIGRKVLRGYIQKLRYGDYS